MMSADAREMSVDAREIRSLLHKPILSFEDRARLARLLSNELDERITPAGIFESEANIRFMRRNFPHERYEPTAIAKGSLVRYGHSIASLCKGDVKSVLSEAFHAASGAGIVDKVVSIVGSGATRHSRIAKRTDKPVRTEIKFTPTDPGRESDKKEIRVLTLRRSALSVPEKARLIALLRSRYKREEVNDKNYVRICLEFLRHYYPEEFARERERARISKLWPRGSGPRIPVSTTSQTRNRQHISPGPVFEPSGSRESVSPEISTVVDLETSSGPVSVPSSEASIRSVSESGEPAQQQSPGSRSS